MSGDRRAHQILIRQAALQDAAAIRDILWETWIATYGSFIPEDDIRSYFDEHYSEAAIHTLLCQPDVEGFIGAWNEVAAGVMVTRRNASEGRFYVSSLYVKPEFQGRGIGKALLLHAAERAVAAGMSELWLGVMVQNVQALAWYRALGFCFVEELPFQMRSSKVSHLIGSISLDKLSVPGKGQI